MEAWEESGADSQHLGVELRRSGHGRGSRQQDHPLGCLEWGGGGLRVVIRDGWRLLGDEPPHTEGCQMEGMCFTLLLATSTTIIT